MLRTISLSYPGIEINYKKYAKSVADNINNLSRKQRLGDFIKVVNFLYPELVQKGTKVFGSKTISLSEVSDNRYLVAYSQLITKLDDRKLVKLFKKYSDELEKTFSKKRSLMVIACYHLRRNTVGELLDFVDLL